MVRADIEATRAYERKRAAERYADYKARRVQAFAMFENACYLCGKAAGDHFHFHHVIYHPVESDYARSGRSLHVRIRRLAEVETSPERFKLLCAGCHSGLELMRSGKRSIDNERLLELLVP